MRLEPVLVLLTIVHRSAIVHTTAKIEAGIRVIADDAIFDLEGGTCWSIDRESSA